VLIASAAVMDVDRFIRYPLSCKLKRRRIVDAAGGRH
jgi:hypothetical protein